MKRFNFRLQSLANLREQEEELWKLKLGQAARAVEELDLAIEQTLIEEHSALRRYRDPLAMHAAQLYMLRMKADRDRYKKERQVAESKRLAILKDYIVARQKAEVLRKVRDKHLVDWKKYELEYQDAQLDDLVAANRLLQSHNSAGSY